MGYIVNYSSESSGLQLTDCYIKASMYSFTQSDAIIFSAHIYVSYEAAREGKGALDSCTCTVESGDALFSKYFSVAELDKASSNPFKSIYDFMYLSDGKDGALMGLDITASARAVTESQRDALTPADGDRVYNEDSSKFQVYNLGGWENE